jgi:hypothetical protein
MPTDPYGTRCAPIGSSKRRRWTTAWETGIVLILLTLFNAVLGLQQEGKAAAVTEIRKTVRSSAADTRNHPGKGDDNPEPLAQDLGTGSNRAGPDGGYASLPAA